jgi:hypothetical protein
MLKPLKMLSPNAAYAEQGCAVPTSGAFIRKGSGLHECLWSKCFASVMLPVSHFPGLGPTSMGLGHFRACAFSI